MATKAKTSSTSRKAPSRKIEDKAQFERFREFAHSHGADESPEAFDQHFRKIVPPKK
jgi:hypothetical protein